MERTSIYLSVLFTLVLISTSYAASNTIANTTLTVVGLPAGAQIPVRFAPNYTTVTYTATNYTTNINVYISANTNATYAGRVPYQWQGAGQTVAYNGVTYTMLPSTYTQTLNVGKDNILGFYTYLNSSLWNTNETAELKAANSSLAKAKMVIAKIQNTSSNVIYNGSLKAGAVAHVASYTNSSAGADITFIKQTIQPYPDAACIYINLASSPFCANATTPDRINVPVINGHYGFTQNTTYPLIITFKASLYGKQIAPFNYSVKDISNNTFLTPLTTTTANSLNVKQTFNIPVTDSVEITAGNGGNANYSKQYIDPVTVPSNIVAYIPITLTNNEGNPLAANTPINITFDAGAYQKYETSNMVNVEFFLYNGMVLNSELWGNYLAETQTSNLYTSNTLMYWINSQWTSSFLPANTGTAPTNTIYLGFAGNVFSTSNDLLNGVTTGALPQLAITGTCGSIDNGKNIFTYYQSFSCLSAIPSGWSSFGTPTVTFNTYNVVLSTGASWAGWNIISPKSLAVGGNFLDAYGNLYSPVGAITRGLVTADTGQATNFYLGVGTECTSCSTTFLVGTSGGGVKETTSATTATNALQIYSAYYPTSSTGFVASNFAFNSLGTGLTESNALNMGWEMYSATTDLYWIDTRIPPPNEIMPATSFGTVTPVGSSCSASITNPSNAIADVGQYESFTASQSNCVSSFTYNILVVNSITPSVIAHNDLLTGQTANSVTYTFQTVSADTANSPEEANVVVTDSGTNTVTSGYSSTFKINSALGTPSISPSSAETFDYGQSITFSSSWSGGTSTYTANWIVVNSITGTQLANALYTGISSTSNTFVWAFPSADAGNTVQGNVLIKDSATTPESTNSIKSATLTLNPALVAGAITPSSPKIDNGQSITLTANPSGGTTPYSYQWYLGAGCNTAISGATSSTYSASPTSNTLYSYQVTDSASTSTSQCSLPYVVNSITSGVSSPYGAAFSPSGTYAYVVNYGNVVIINTATNTVVNSIESGFSNPVGISFSPSGTYAYVTNEGNNNVVIINTATNTVVNSIISGFSNPDGVSFSPSGTYAYVSNYGSGNVVTINTATNTVVNSIISGFSNPAGISFSPSGTYAYVINEYPNSNVAIINTATNTVTGSITSGFVGATGVAFSPSGLYAYVTNDGDNNVVIINTATNTITGSIISGFNNPFEASFSPSGTYAYVTNDDGNNVVILNTPEVVNVNSALGTPSLDTSNFKQPTIDSGQSVTFISSWTGGTPDYTAKLYSSSTSTCNTGSTSVQTLSSLTSGSASFSSVSPTSTTYYCIFVTDSAYSPETTNSINSEVVVNSALGTPTISPSSATYDTGQTITLTASISGGTPSYSYQWYNDTSGTATAISGATSSTLTETAGSTAETVKYYVKVTDSATTPESTTSAIESYVINTALSSGSPTPTGKILDSGQSLTITANPSGGTTPYSYQWYSGTSSTCSSDAAISGATGSSYLASPTSSTYYCYKVTDSATTPTSEISSTDLVTVNSALGIPSIIPSNTAIDNGQSTVLSSTWTGGTTDYTAKLYSSSTSTCNTGSNLVQTLSSLTSGSASFSSLSQSSTTYYCIFVTDSASTPETTNSINSKVVVNSALSIPTLSSSPSLPSTQASGNTITFTSSWSGGTSTYTANYIITNTITNDLVANMLFTGITTTSNSFAWTIPSVDIGNTVEANVIITDSASTPETANSVESNTLTIVSPYTAPTINSFSCPSQSSIYSGGSVTCTVSINNGESPYTYNWLVVNSITKSVVSNELFTNIASTTNTLTFTSQDTSDSPLQFNVIITDSHPTTINSIYSSKLEVVSVPSITPTSPTNIISGSTLSITASNILGGTSPYTYNFNVFNSISGDIVGNYLISGITSNSYTFNFITTNEMAGNFLNANVIVTDAASVTTNSINSAIIHVENYPTVTISPSNTFTEGTSGASLTTSGNPSSDYLKAYISGQLVASGTGSLFVSLTGYTVAYYSANVEDTNTGLWTNTTFNIASSSSGGGGGGGGGSPPKSVSVIVPVINKTLNITTIPTQQSICLSGGVLVPILGTLNNFYSTTISAGILAIPIWIIVAAILLAMSGYLYIKSNKSSSYVMVLLVFLGALYVVLPVISAC
jgi:YVTN family beta-propeller protein